MSNAQQTTDTGGNSAFTHTSLGDMANKPVQYICGDCNAKCSLKKGDAVRCLACGYRVLYKERTNRYVYRLSHTGAFMTRANPCPIRMVQFEAR
jgi:DNA-directed RNA polymerase I, II, and III subunit RPABC4